MQGKYLVVLAVVLSSAYLANAKCCARSIWSAWAPSGACSDSCGSCGKITYTRRCISARNGCPCSGPVRKTKHCNIMPCKYPRESCCGKMNAIVTRGKVICGPQPADRPEAPGPAPGTPCTAPPRPPPAPRPRTTKRITKATTKPTTTDWTPGCGPPPGTPGGPGGPGGPPAEASTTTTPASPCPFVDGEYTQPDAQAECQELGGNLAIIDTPAATQCILDQATKTSQEATSAWIGLVDTKQNSDHTANCTCWNWLDGSAYTYENFAPGQPNNAEEKEWCSEVFLPASNYPAGTWNDELCEEYTRPAVCSVPASPTPATGEASAGPVKSTPLAITASTGPTQSIASTTALAATTETPPCPDGWGYCPGASRCYKLIDGDFTQPEAQSQCRAVGGNLATVDSTAATQCLLDYAAKSSQEDTSAWIGLVDRAENIKHTPNCTCWKWLDGSPFDYQNFEQREPNNVKKNEWCTEVYLPRANYPAGTWNDEVCEAHKRSALCSAPADGPKDLKQTTGVSTPATSEADPISKSSTPPAFTASTGPTPSVAGATTLATTAKTPSCPAGWSYCPGASRCYKLVDGGFTQPEAQSKCRELGGNLATVDSAENTQCFLDNASKSSQEATSAWIGLVDKAENINHTANCSCWKWLDGSPFNYENFAPGQPNNAEGKEWCSEVFLPASNYPAGTWNDELCEGYKRPALCSVPANGPNDQQQTTAVSTPATSKPTTTAPSKITPLASSSTSGSSKPSTPLASSTSARSTPTSTKASTPAATTAEPPCPCEEDSTPAGSPTSTGTTPSTASTTAPTTSTKVSPCPDGWRYCPGAAHCYKLIDGGYTQPQAQSQCRSVGGNLATVNSVAATQCVLDYSARTAPNAVSAWIGLVDPTENSKHSANCTCWKWLDGTPYNYEKFEPSEPNNVGGKEWCNIVNLRQSSIPAGVWLDWNCGDLTIPALCSVPANGHNNVPKPTAVPSRATVQPTTSGISKQPTTPARPIPSVPPTPSTRRATPTPAATSKPSSRASTKPTSPPPSTKRATTPATTTKTPPCPRDWRYCPGASHCYKLIDGGYTQPEAQSQCHKLGGNLATVDSAAANQCLLDYAAKSPHEGTSAWIGLVDKTKNSKHTANCTCWTWLDGSPFKYENFAPAGSAGFAKGQPNNQEGREWCSEIFLPGSKYPAGTWNDELCDGYKRPALCSVRAK